ncbi:hypothetical protein [Helicobacter trogontum]|nr:hypothetical protein [Helicobacter trogontum]
MHYTLGVLRLLESAQRQDFIYGSIAKHKHTLVRQFNYSYLPCV